MLRVLFRIGSAGGLAAALSGCSTPTLTQEGQLVFSEGGQRGASVLTPNGVEFIDRRAMPKPVVRRSAFEAWRPPTGFLLPADGILRETSRPIAIQGRGLLVVLRASDAIVPAWGGELLVRLDAIVPERAFPAVASSVRRPLQVVVAIDSDGQGAQALVDAALDSLGQRDRVALVDSADGARIAVPLIPGTHRTLLEGAAERLIERRSRGVRRPRDLGAALSLARRLAGSTLPDGVNRERRILLITDGMDLSIAKAAQARAAASAGIRLMVAASTDRVERDLLEALAAEPIVGADEAERLSALEAAFAPPGDVVLRDLELSVSSAPAPTHLVEASAGELAMTLEDDFVDLGDLYVGEARTEVLRISVPEWTAGERYQLRMVARYRDAATGRSHRAAAEFRLKYVQDIEELANRRHGDVIAYASGLAMVRRLERAFLGSRADSITGLDELVRWQARSLAELGSRSGDRSLAQQAEVLETLRQALRD